MSQMTAFLNDIPLGKYRTEVGLALRHVWFPNGCLISSEVWSGYHKSDFDELEKIDCQLLRLNIGAQAKVPSEMLYLETSDIYVAMKENPLKYDWIELISTDKELLPNDTKEDEDIKKLTHDELKIIVKKSIKNIAVKKLEKQKESHKQLNFSK